MIFLSFLTSLLSVSDYLCVKFCLLQSNLQPNFNHGYLSHMKFVDNISKA